MVTGSQRSALGGQHWLVPTRMQKCQPSLTSESTASYWHWFQITVEVLYFFLYCPCMFPILRSFHQDTNNQLFFWWRPKMLTIVNLECLNLVYFLFLIWKKICHIWKGICPAHLVCRRTCTMASVWTLVTGQGKDLLALQQSWTEPIANYAGCISGHILLLWEISFWEHKVLWSVITA